jgi:long-chain acyl-CoA synthetase
VANVLQTRTWLAGFRDRAETILAVLPFFHSYGMTTSLHLGIQAQATLLLLPRFDLADALKRIRKHRPTIFCGVPSMYDAINRSPRVQPKDVNSIRLCVSGGAALPAEVQRSFEELTGGKLVEGYGLSETSPVAIVNPVFGHRKSGTIGVPIPDTMARVVDHQTRAVLAPGEVGELAIKGPQVMKEYWRMPEETREVLEDGWLYTGDLASQDEEGFITIVDRKKDVIISAGMNVYPREIEELLLTHPDVVEVAVVGVPSRVRQEVVKAFIVTAEGRHVAKTDIIDFCVDKLSKFKIPRQIEFRSDLPKSAVGKILKRVLLEEEVQKLAEREARRSK